MRPFIDREKKTVYGLNRCVSIKDGHLEFKRGVDTKEFKFDFIGDESINQKAIFEHTAKPVADCCLEGYNGTIFAYGQTGAGKTYTIQGPNLD